MSSRFAFIPPALPRSRPGPPSGPEWLHEVKFDGYRVQVHTAGADVEIFSKNGHTFSSRFPTIAYLLRELPARSAIIDAEIVASSSAGVPDFGKLHRRSAEPGALGLWAFDLLAINGRDLRERPLEARRKRLQALVERFDCPAVLFSEAFSDPARLLQKAERLQLEGIVSKRRSAPYRSGDRSDWCKIKTAAWREANRERHKLFDKS